MRNEIMKKFAACFLVLCIVFTMLPVQLFAAESEKLRDGKDYSGFKLISQKDISEIDSKVYVFEHKKSGAKLIFLENDDSNKVFSISFRTPPKDNTGVNHIIEHSVLSGSKNYPVKSTILTMLKSSLATFANAFTYPDRTTYPVSSKNEKDFYNLMGIYLDAVFYPNITKEPNIFKQEGWRYELESETSDLNYNGIVYNEMKGNESTPYQKLNVEIMKSLLPNTPYNWESGGNPKYIPDLTYNKLVDTYKKNYQPSNSYIYLYGDVDIKKALNYIDSNYLKKFNKSKVDTKIPLQKPFKKEKEVTAEYAVEKGTDENNKSYLSMNFVMDEITNKELVIACSYLADALLNSQASPLKNALISNGIGTNVYGQFNYSMRQPIFSIIAENADASQKDKFVSIINQTLKDLVENGMDKEYLKSIGHIFELQMRSTHSTADRGILYNQLVMYGWLYDKDPTLYLQFNDTLDKINKKIPDNYFETLIKKYMLNNKHRSIVVLNPSNTLQEKNDQELKKKLEKYKARLSDHQLKKLVQETKDFNEWQLTPDSEEALAKMPVLEVSDLDRESPQIPLIEKEENGVKVLAHPLYTNKLAYVNLYFDTSAVPEDKLPYLYLLSNILGGMDTKNYSYSELLGKINSKFGSLKFTPEAFINYKDSSIYYPKHTASLFALPSDLPEIFELLGEIVNNTKFDNTLLLGQYIKQIRNGLEYTLTSSPIDSQATRLQSYFMDIGKYNEVGNMEYYKFICDLDNNFSQKSGEIDKNLQEVMKTVFNRNGLVASITDEESAYSNFSEGFKKFVDGLSNEEVVPQTYTFDSTVKNEGITIASQIQYVAKGYDFKKLGYEFSGKMRVLNTILNTEYLMQKVRIEGGAYGSGSIISDNGFVCFLSWFDPNLKGTLDVYDKASEYLENFNPDQKSMNGYIIRTIGNSDTSDDPKALGILSDRYYFRGITQEDLQKDRDEVLSTSVEDIRAYSKMISDIMSQNYINVIGSDAAISNNKELFESIHPMLIN